MFNWRLNEVFLELTVNLDLLVTMMYDKGLFLVDGTVNKWQLYKSGERLRVIAN